MAVFPISVVIDPSGARRGARATKQELRGIDKAAKRVANSIKTAFLSLGAALGAREIVKLADSFTFLQNQLRTVTKDTGELAKVTEQLKRVANDTRFDLQTTAMAYTRFSRALKGVVDDQKEVLAFTKSINQAIKISGATAQEARNGLIQFSQGLSAGALRGDEFRSVTEQLPVILDVLQEKMGKSRAELREMAFAGQLTGKIIFDAFKKARGELDDRFGKVLPTISDQVTVLKNNFTVFLGKLQQATNIFGLLADAIGSVGQAFVLVTDVMDTTRDVFREITTIASSASRSFGTLALVIAGPLVAAIGSVILATGGFTAALIALAAVNPAIWIAVATAGVLAYRDSLVDATVGVLDYMDSINPFTDEIKTATIAQTIWFQNSLKNQKRLVDEALAVKATTSFWGEYNVRIRAVDFALGNLVQGRVKTVIDTFKVLADVLGVIDRPTKKLKRGVDGLAKALRQLQDQVFPLEAKFREYAEALFTVEKAQRRGLITWADATRIMAEYRKQIFPVAQATIDLAKAQHDYNTAVAAMSFLLERQLITVTQLIAKERELRRARGQSESPFGAAAPGLEQGAIAAGSFIAKDAETGRIITNQNRRNEAFKNAAKERERIEKDQQRERERRLKEQIKLAQQFSDALVDAAFDANQSFGQFFVNFLRDIGKAIAKALLLKTIMAAAGQPHAGLTPIARLLGFANGGAFTVGGSGGTDSQPIAFMATPGETVEVRTPGQQSRAQETGVTGESNIKLVVQDNRRDAMIELLSSDPGERAVLAIIGRNRVKLGI